MRKISFIGILIISFSFMQLCSAEVKKSDLAGIWYASSKTKLKNEIERYMENADTHAIEGQVVALISPHAGFEYSGTVIASGFKSVIDKNVKTVAIVGFSHRRRFKGVAVLNSEGFETPLGITKIDKKGVERLTEINPKIFHYPTAFEAENSIEMIIPFISVVFPEAHIIPIVIGEQSHKNCEITAKALYEFFRDKENFLMIASSDMCHYLPYRAAHEMDAMTIRLIENFDPERFFSENIAWKRQLMCGYGAVYSVMLASQLLGADKVEIIKYANSGDTAGDKKRVVGYLSAAIVKSTGQDSGNIKKIQDPKEGDGMLDKEQKRKMLELARESITHYLKTKEYLPVEEKDPVLNRKMGAFVTLHEHDQLRGCIGNLIGNKPFYLTVRDMAVEAATGDPRFRPVTFEEMDKIDIEISALSPLKKIETPEEIKMGKHGVVVKKGFLSGVYLPQVANETGWTREQFMNSLCEHKAGIQRDAWKKGDCEIYIFEAMVFGEKEAKP